MSAQDRIAVCSWSLAPGSPAELVERLGAAGISRVQLALDPVRRGEWPLEETRRALDQAGVAVVSGMMATLGEDYSTLEAIRRTGGFRPDETWPANRAAAAANARLAKAFGLTLVSFHAGFLPEGPGSPEREVLLERLREVVDLFAAEGVRCAFETGQETAATLLDFLGALERPAAGVNFDPANMILYGMGDPVDALAELLPRVLQVHVKDATRTQTPGTWGSEVPAGEGEVDWKEFFAVLDRDGIRRELVIEREAGADRAGDIARARELVRAHLDGTP